MALVKSLNRLEQPWPLIAALLLPLFIMGCDAQSPDTTPNNTGQNNSSPLVITTFDVQESPFKLCFGDVCTAEASATAVPSPYSYSEGPRPVVNPATATAFPAFGWVVGQTMNEVIPTSIWQGNRLSGNDTGTLYQVTSVASSETFADRTELLLNTNYNNNAAPAKLILTNHASGALEAKLEPPAGMAEAGIALTLFTIDTPADEGLFGMGARKDFFNQRGKLRNVWTEQQNTGLGSFADLSFTGAGAPAGLPTGQFADTGLNQDADDAALAEERTSFPNGAQAAYWVEAFVVGARGWAAWTTDKYFQRIDLAATDAGKLRWQVVDSDVVTLVFADGGEGGIEQASRAYTDYWGRAPAPTIKSWEPWIDTLNQGEGEAAPNGQGFWGGQRARCEMEDFIAKSAQHSIPFSLIGVEGWHVIPQTHPNCTVQTTAEICGSDYPVDSASLQAEIAAGTSFLNEQDNCTDADKTFFDYVREQGFEIGGYWNFFHTRQGCTEEDQCTSTDPGVPVESARAYADAYTRDIYVKAADPNANTTDDNGNHTVTTNRGGISSLIDFTNDAAVPFWKGQLARMFDLGITIFMHDFGELTTDDMLFDEGENLQESHNLFAFKYQQAARQAIDEYKAENNLGDDFAPYFYARAGMTGTCSFTPGVFPGDESTSWDAGHGLPSVIPTMLNLSLSGCYAFTTDIGGYFDFTTPRTTEDLFIRWSQLSALTPVMRIHSSTFNGSVFPWTWSEGEDLAAEDNPQWDTIDIFRRYARLKSKLIPLTDHWVQRAVNNGDIGPVRPIILEDPSATAQVQDYEWLYGENLLVAPVYEEDMAELAVYFPAGANWQQVTVTADGDLAATDQIFTGGQTSTLTIDNATLADIPLFVRCGSSDPLLPALAGVGVCE